MKVLFLFSLIFCVHSLDLLSFNIQNFGVTKFSKQPVINILIDIIEEYDLILVMEYVDVSQTVLPGFVQQLNNHVADRGIYFNYSLSERLGRSNNKEQYVFLYRTNAVEIINTFQYSDENDFFERPPYAILARSIKSGVGVVPPFFIIASHTKPTDAVSELNYLDEVFDEAQEAFSTDLGMIMGDLNADCSYVSNANYAQLDLIMDANFTWWIDKLADTTTSNSNCAYDRVITRLSLNPFVVEDSVEIFLFDNFFNLTSDLTSAVSDHYPIRLSLQGVLASASSVMKTTTLQEQSTRPNTNSISSSKSSTSTLQMTTNSISASPTTTMGSGGVSYHTATSAALYSMVLFLLLTATIVM